MPFSKLAACTAVIADLDGTCYQGNILKSTNLCVRAAVYAAKTLKKNLTTNILTPMAMSSFDIHGEPYSGIAAQTALPQKQLHELFFKHLSAQSLKIEKLPCLDHQIIGWQGDFCILTGAGRAWAEYALHKIGLGIFANIHQCICREDVDMQLKSESTAPVIHALESMEADAETTILVDDTAANLKPAHELGLCTVWVNNCHSDEKPAFVDYVFPTFVDMLWKLQEIKSQQTHGGIHATHTESPNQRL